MPIALSISPEKITGKIIQFIRNTIKKAGFSRLVIGLSGGLDSAVSCVLAVKALGVANIYVGLFPYGKLNSEGLKNAKLVIDRFDIPSSNLNLVDIRSLVDPIIKLDPGIDDLRRGNIMARLRMILLFDLAKKYKALVLGTENKTEHLLGYFTRFGDEASDIEPLRHLYKTQVRQLASYLEIPKHIITKPPTAGFWLGQTDEKELGFTYKEADQILHLFVDLKKSREEMIKKGFKEEIVDRVVKRLEKNDFKHELPYFLHKPQFPIDSGNA